MGNLNSNYGIAQEWRLRLLLCCKIQFPFWECNFCGKCNPPMWTCFCLFEVQRRKESDTESHYSMTLLSHSFAEKKCIKFRIINQGRSGTNRSWNVNYFFMNRVQLAAISFFRQTAKSEIEHRFTLSRARPREVKYDNAILQNMPSTILSLWHTTNIIAIYVTRTYLKYLQD